MPINNSIDAIIPIDTRLGGTGLVAPEQYGIMIGAAGTPVHTTVLDDRQILLGFTNDFPEATTLVEGTNVAFTQSSGSLALNSKPSFIWNTVVSPTPSVDLIPFNSYVTAETNIGDRVTFFVPNGTALMGDEYRMNTWGIGAVGFRISRIGSQIFWYNGASGREIEITGGFEQSTSVLMACIDNSSPGAENFMVLAVSGDQRSITLIS